MARRRVLASSVLGAGALWVTAAVAQYPGVGQPAGSGMNVPAAQRRYQRATTGADINDWKKRLKDPDARVRLDAVKALGESGNPDAIEYLIEATADTDIRVRTKGIDYLGAMRATDATPLLVQMLFLGEVEPEIKHRVLVALGKIGDTRAAQPIAEFLGRDLEPQIQATAIYSLGEIGDPSVLETLETIAANDTDPSIRRCAQEAEGKITERQRNAAALTGPVAGSLPTR